MSAFLCNAFSPTTTLTNNTYVYGTPCGTNSTVLNPVTSPNPPPSATGLRSRFRSGRLPS
jgi:hypothetical protein